MSTYSQEIVEVWEITWVQFILVVPKCTTRQVTCARGHRTDGMTDEIMVP